MTNTPLNTAYSACVALAIQANTVKILLLKRTDKNYWCHVGGTIENNETAWQAAIRELREETGLSVQSLHTADYIDRFYQVEQNQISLVPVFIALVSATDPITLNTEHNEYRWCTFDEAIALVPHPNMKKIYRHIWESFINGVNVENLDQALNENILQH